MGDRTRSREKRERGKTLWAVSQQVKSSTGTQEKRQQQKDMTSGTQEEGWIESERNGA